MRELTANERMAVDIVLMLIETGAIDVSYLLGERIQIAPGVYINTNDMTTWPDSLVLDSTAEMKAQLARAQESVEKRLVELQRRGLPEPEAKVYEEYVPHARTRASD